MTGAFDFTKDFKRDKEELLDKDEKIANQG